MRDRPNSPAPSTSSQEAPEKIPRSTISTVAATLATAPQKWV